MRPVSELTGNTSDAGLGFSVAGADTNGDGLGDLLVGSMRDGGQVHLGSTAGMSAVPSWQVPWEDPLPHGYELTSAGDVDGDGLDDVLVRPTNQLLTSPENPLGLGSYWGPESVRLFAGDASGAASIPLWSMPSGWGTGTTASGVGDLDADGRDDIALTGSTLLVIVSGDEIVNGPPTGGTDTGDTGVEDTGVEDTGVEDTGVEDTGVEDTGVENTSIEDTSIEDTAAETTTTVDTDPPTTPTTPTTPTSPTDPNEEDEAKACGCSAAPSWWWGQGLLQRRR